MTQEINRVIVPLDAASETGAAIDTAARLAARWRVPLHGVFVEDEELIGLASLPFARQVTLGAGVEPLTKDRVDIAAQIAGFCDGTLTVAQTPDPAGSADFTAWVSKRLEGYTVTPQTEPIQTEPVALRQRIIELDCRLLVLEAGDWKARVSFASSSTNWLATF